MCLFFIADSFMRWCKTGRIVCGSRRDGDMQKRMLLTVQVKENQRKRRSAPHDRDRRRLVLSERCQMVKSHALYYETRLRGFFLLIVGGGKNRDCETEIRDVESRQSDTHL